MQKFAEGNRVFAPKHPPSMMPLADLQLIFSSAVLHPTLSIERKAEEEEYEIQYLIIFLLCFRSCFHSVIRACKETLSKVFSGRFVRLFFCKMDTIFSPL